MRPSIYWTYDIGAGTFGPMITSILTKIAGEVVVADRAWRYRRDGW